MTGKLRRHRRGWAPLRWILAVLAVLATAAFGLGWMANAHGTRPLMLAWAVVMAAILYALWTRRPTYRTRSDLTCRWCTWASGCRCPDATEDT